NYDVHTLAIHSIYIDENWSNRDISVFIFQRIYNSLEDGQTAILQMNKFSGEKEWHHPYRRKIRFERVELGRVKFHQAHLLATHTLRRQSTISAGFDETIASPILTTYEEEKKRRENER